ncbi:MAG: amino acid ABC transporter substrate-binding protein [Acidimicrobiia bacterium]|nr:amino acid ABC transporter substrate-binding protein [Acidimicrobiia bacterium]
MNKPNTKSVALRWLAVLFAVVLLAAACGSDSEESSSGGTLAAVQARGTLKCAINDNLPGFGSQQADATYVGFDVDFCRVVAAAVLGNANAVEYTPLDAGQRFPTLQSGDIDVLIRNTTWTASRDGNEQANFLFTTFYDGQGFMVHADSDISSLEDMANASICVLQGTTTLLNLNSEFNDRGIPFTPLEFQANDELQPAFTARTCEVWTADSSALAAFSASLSFPTRVLSEVISKEPLGPVVSDGDTEWAQVVNWATMATIQAEEYGINSQNLSEFMGSGNSNIRRFLGVPSPEGVEPDVGLGLPADFAEQIISQVGNYAEIFERHLTPLGLERDRNALWTDGGLMYVPPFR